MSGLGASAQARGAELDEIPRHALAPGLLSCGTMRGLRLVLVLVVLVPDPVTACPAPGCWEGSFAPRTGATIPANAPALRWRPMLSAVDGRLSDGGRVTLTQGPDGASLGFTTTALEDGTVLIVPDEPLVVGARYVLTDTHVCELEGLAGPQVTFDVGPAAPLPTRLGSVRAAKPVRAPLEVAASGTCNETIDTAHVDVRLDVDPAATPWVPLLQLATRVDGRPWRARSDINDLFPLGESWMGAGRDRLYAACEPGADLEGLALGDHAVTFEARLPGVATVLATEPREVVLACDPDGGDEAEDDGAGGGCAAGGLGASPWLGLAVLARRRRRRA